MLSQTASTEGRIIAADDVTGRELTCKSSVLIPPDMKVYGGAILTCGGTQFPRRHLDSCYIWQTI